MHHLSRFSNVEKLPTILFDGCVVSGHVEILDVHLYHVAATGEWDIPQNIFCMLRRRYQETEVLELSREKLVYNR